MPAGDRRSTMDELQRVPPEKHVPVHAVRVLLDDVRSRHNVGSIFRSADAFGIAGLDLCGFTPCPPHREIEKTALGATSTVPWEQHMDTVARVLQLKAQGHTVFAVEQTMLAKPLHEVVVPDGPVAIVLGNELSGVSDHVIQACDACIVIPQFGSKHSLNVSVCAGIVLWWLVMGHHPLK